MEVKKSLVKTFSKRFGDKSWNKRWDSWWSARLKYCYSKHSIAVSHLSVSYQSPNNKIFFLKMADNYSSKKPDLISNLPDEILVHILKNLCYCQSDKVSHVSTRFSILSKEQNLTQKMMNGFDSSSSQSKVQTKNYKCPLTLGFENHEQDKDLILG